MLLSEKLEHRGRERRRLLQMRLVTGGCNRRRARVRQETRISFKIGLRYKAVAFATNKERRSGDAVQAPLELWVMHPALPGEQRERLAVAEHGGKIGVRHFRAVGLHAGGIVIKQLLELDFRRSEERR